MFLMLFLGILILVVGVAVIDYKSDGLAPSPLPVNTTIGPQVASELAETLNLDYLKDSERIHYRGEYRGKIVEIQPHNVSVKPPEPFPFKLQVESRRNRRHLPNERSYQTGDPIFDQAFEIGASPDVLLFLDKPTRDLFQDLYLNITSDGMILFDAKPDKEKIDRMCVLCDRFAVADSRALALQALESETPIMRQKGLQILALEPLNSVEKDRVRLLLDDRDWQIQRQAAGLLGSEAIDFYKNILIETSGKPNIGQPEDVFEDLARLNSPEAREVLIKALDLNFTLTAVVQLVKALGPIEDHLHAEGLIRKWLSLALSSQLISPDEMSLINLILEALTEYDPKIYRPFMIDRYKPQMASQARLSILKAWERFGERQDIEQLIAIRESGEEEISEQASKTIKAIQARIGNVERGWLSLDGKDQSGRLSMVPDQDGSLSLIDQKETGNE